MLKRILLAVVVAGFCSTGAFAQEVFLAFGQGANVSDTATASDTDTTGTLFLYSRDFSFSSINVDVLSSNTGVADSVSATIFNPEFMLDQFDPNAITNRFTNATDGAAPGDDIEVVSAIDPDTGLNAVSIVGVGAFNGDFGVNSLASSVDSTFDADANAFLIAEITYDILGAGTTEFTLGTTDISFLVSTSPAEVFGTPALGGATLTVGTAAVPEPSTVGLLALGLVGFVARRRR